jgi:hypothetical protein
MTRTSFDTRMVVAVALAAAFYAVFYFAICGLPIAGTQAFRIDYFTSTVTSADDFLKALIHSRPVVTLFFYAQAMLANASGGQVRYVTYLVQHIALLVYFFSIAKVVESIFQVRLAIVSLLMAWLLYILTPVVIEGVYKLETFVGTLSMLFGGLAMLFLMRWERSRGKRSAVAFLGCYLASILAKEDFILPPLFLLAWYIVRNGDWKAQVLARKWVLIAMFGCLAFFLVFNKAIIPGRAYIEPVNRASSPYFMTLAPASVIGVLKYYITDCGRRVELIFMLYALTSVAAVLLRRHWKETILVAMIVAGLLAPYLIMPNHLYSYYSEKWLAWQTITSLVILQVISGKRRHLAVAASCLVGAAILVPTLIGVYGHHDALWFRAGYYRGIFSVSRNVHDTLAANREAINRHPRVAVLGVGPGQIEHSPWQGNGETAFYLSGDLKLSPQWIVFVKSDGPGYRVDNFVRPELAPQSRVIVKDIKELDHYRNLPALVFQKDGSGSLVALDKVDIATLTPSEQYRSWTLSPADRIAASPREVSACPNHAASSVQVTWDVSASQREGAIQIWVRNASTRKLWLAAGPAGTAASGPWVEPGFQFQIEDPATHKRLAAVTIGATCP